MRNPGVYRRHDLDPGDDAQAWRQPYEGVRAGRLTFKIDDDIVFIQACISLRHQHHHYSCMHARMQGFLHACKRLPSVNDIHHTMCPRLHISSYGSTDTALLPALPVLHGIWPRRLCFRIVGL